MFALAVASEIDAPPELVWRALIDLPRFREWNPFIRAASGKPALGARLRMRVRPSLRVPLVFRPKVTVCDENRELRWRGHFVRPWIGAGDHTFSLEPIGKDRTRFVQRETFTGLIPAFLARLIEREARRGFELMNAALKARVERAQNAAS